VKEFLSLQNITYKEYDVSRNATAATEMVRLTNQRGVPVTVINGTAVVGFDRGRLDELIGQAKRPHLGASVIDAATIAQKSSSSLREGAYVGRVRPGSPAAQAGLQTSDIIVAIGGRSVRTAFDLEDYLARMQAGQAVSLRYKRANQEIETTVRF
jgi:S1-C subfamily serine protease